VADPQLPHPTDDWVYADRFLRALDTAARLHATQVGKGSGVPYVSHLLGTCSIVLDYGGDEDEAIAALPHDALEDVAPTEMARDAVASFGPRVLAIVEGCTEHRAVPKPPWRERKERYIEHQATADASVLLVAAADKLHNARSLVADLRGDGSPVWDRFNAGRDDTLWYYGAVIEAMRGNPAPPADLVDELERVVTELASVAD
jgi:GTP pyrophosphokinase